MKKVGIIGGSGYIGSFNTKKFLDEGYQVKASVTDLSKKEKYEHLKNLSNAKHLEIEELDVENNAQLEKFIKGCNIIVHGGTPFQLNVEDPKTELFDPTIKGTENFLAAIQKTPEIEKLVFIASVAALNTSFPFFPDREDLHGQMSEEDPPYWNEENHPYAQAKYFANQAVEKFIKEHPDLKTEITTVSPVGVMGPAMSERQDSTSMGVQYLFKNKIAPDAFFQMFYDQDLEWAVVDVSDIAEGVYKAATTKGLHGKNYILSSESYRISDLTLMLNNKEPKGKASIVYKNDLAKNELDMNFKPARVPLNQFQ